MAQPITLTPILAPVRVQAGALVLGETRRALRLSESGHPPRIYIPRADLAMQHLAQTRQSSHCPWKGLASYYRLAADGAGDAVAWSYETPLQGMEPISGHLAFYPGAVTLTEG